MKRKILIGVIICMVAMAKAGGPEVKDVRFVGEQATKENQHYAKYQGTVEGVEKEFVNYLIQDTTLKFVNTSDIKSINPPLEKSIVFFIQYHPKEKTLDMAIFIYTNYAEQANVGVKQRENDMAAKYHEVINTRWADYQKIKAGKK